jgi:hypothetical protein
MANNKRAGNTYFRFKVREAARVARIDYRAKKKVKDKEDDRDEAQSGYSITKDGDRVWSF